MRPLLIVIALALPACSPARPAPTIPCEFHHDGSRVEDCAVWDKDGTLRIRREALAHAAFRPEGIAEAWIYRQPYFVTRTGKTAPALLYDNGADDFVEGLARIVRSGKVGFVNPDLTEVVPPRWDFARPFEGGYAQVCEGCTPRRVGDEHTAMVGGKWGVIDRTGRVVVPVAYEQDAVPAPASIDR